MAAFTLAELLITLGIIGVVAVMTMPTLIGKYKEKQTVTAVKTAYSLFSQAFLRVAGENGSLENLYDSTKTAKENNILLLDELSKYINIDKKCIDVKGCMPGKYKTLTGKEVNWADWENHTSMLMLTAVLSNGTSFWIVNHDISVEVAIDVNGAKAPNQMGIDWFYFIVYKDNNRLIAGTKTQNVYSDCDKDNMTSQYNGYQCSEWIIKYDNMDYLRRRVTVDPPEASE